MRAALDAGVAGDGAAGAVGGRDGARRERARRRPLRLRRLPAAQGGRARRALARDSRAWATGRSSRSSRRSGCPQRCARSPTSTPERAVAVCRELTKRFEEVVRGTAGELAERFAEPPKGEITLVVGVRRRPCADRGCRSGGRGRARRGRNAAAASPPRSSRASRTRPETTSTAALCDNSVISFDNRRAAPPTVELSVLSSDNRRWCRCVASLLLAAVRRARCIAPVARRLDAGRPTAPSCSRSTSTLRIRTPRAASRHRRRGRPGLDRASRPRRERSTFAGTVPASGKSRHDHDRRRLRRHADAPRLARRGEGRDGRRGRRRRDDRPERGRRAPAAVRAPRRPHRGGSAGLRRPALASAASALCSPPRPPRRLPPQPAAPVPAAPEAAPAPVASPAPSVQLTVAFRASACARARSDSRACVRVGSDGHRTGERACARCAAGRRPSTSGRPATKSAAHALRCTPTRRRPPRSQRRGRARCTLRLSCGARRRGRPFRHAPSLHSRSIGERRAVGRHVRGRGSASRRRPFASSPFTMRSRPCAAPRHDHHALRTRRDHSAPRTRRVRRPPGRAAACPHRRFGCATPRCHHARGAGRPVQRPAHRARRPGSAARARRPARGGSPEGALRRRSYDGSAVEAKTRRSWWRRPGRMRRGTGTWDTWRASACRSDAFARYHRLKGNDVLMVSGTDEHGTPVMVAADREGKPLR